MRKLFRGLSKRVFENSSNEKDQTESGLPKFEPVLVKDSSSTKGRKFQIGAKFLDKRYDDDGHWKGGDDGEDAIGTDLGNEVVTYRGLSIDALDEFARQVMEEVLGRDVQLYIVTKSYDGLPEGITMRVFRDGDNIYGKVPYRKELFGFVEECLTPKDRRDWSIEDVCEHVILPATLEKQCFYVTLLEEKDPKLVGPLYKGAFVSNARQCKFLSLVEAIKASSDDWGNDFVWLDIFCANQPLLTEQMDDVDVKKLRYEILTHGLHTAIQHFDDYLIFFDSFEAPTPVSRAWCIWELYGAIDKMKEINVVTALEDTDEFWWRSMDVSKVFDLKLENMKCHDPNDFEMIKEAIERLPKGWRKAKRSVRDALAHVLAENIENSVLKRTKGMEKEPIVDGKMFDVILDAAMQFDVLQFPDIAESYYQYLLGTIGFMHVPRPLLVTLYEPYGLFQYRLVHWGHWAAARQTEEVAQLLELAEDIGTKMILECDSKGIDTRDMRAQQLRTRKTLVGLYIDLSTWYDKRSTLVPSKKRNLLKKSKEFANKSVRVAVEPKLPMAELLDIPNEAEKWMFTQEELDTFYDLDDISLARSLHIQRSICVGTLFWQFCEGVDAVNLQWIDRNLTFLERLIEIGFDQVMSPLLAESTNFNDVWDVARAILRGRAYVELREFCLEIVKDDPKIHTYLARTIPLVDSKWFDEMEPETFLKVKQEVKEKFGPDHICVACYLLYVHRKLPMDSWIEVLLESLSILEREFLGNSNEQLLLGVYSALTTAADEVGNTPLSLEASNKGLAIFRAEHTPRPGDFVLRDLFFRVRGFALDEGGDFEDVYASMRTHMDFITRWLTGAHKAVFELFRFYYSSMPSFDKLSVGRKKELLLEWISLQELASFDQLNVYTLDSMYDLLSLADGYVEVAKIYQTEQQYNDAYRLLQKAYQMLRKSNLIELSKTDQKIMESVTDETEIGFLKETLQDMKKLEKSLRKLVKKLIDNRLKLEEVT